MPIFFTLFLALFFIYFGKIRTCNMISTPANIHAKTKIYAFCICNICVSLNPILYTLYHTPTQRTLKIYNLMKMTCQNLISHILQNRETNWNMPYLAMKSTVKQRQGLFIKFHTIGQFPYHLIILLYMKMW